MKIELTGTLNFTTEDSGCARVARLVDNSVDRVFVRVQSWDEPPGEEDTPSHPEVDQLEGKKVRVTIEEIG